MAKDSPDSVSRRKFLVRAGQVGAGLTILGPALERGLGALPVHYPPAGEAARLAATASHAAADLTSLYSGLSWRLLGPFRGGRCDAVTGVPGRPEEFYFGAVAGGVWKTIDGGRMWEPVFDGQPIASIGAIAVAPTAPDMVYVGSGENTLRDSASYGNGVYRSADAGRTWSHLGLADTQHIGRIVVHPTDPNTVFVAAIGHLYSPNEERGVFRSRDGGRTWEKVLYRGPDVGAVELAIDPANPQVLYAGLWNTRRPPWFVYAPSNGPGGGIFKSTDGGTTWKQLAGGLPNEGMGKTGIAVCPSNPRRLYAVVDNLLPDPNAPKPAAPAAPNPFAQAVNGQGGFFRSDDAGETWTKLSSDPALWGRGWYFEHVVADPKDPDTVYVSNVAVSRSMDGGRTWSVIRGSPGGDDYHQAWVSPDDPSTFIVSSDQGAIITRNARDGDPRQMTWSSWYNQPTAQIYHVSVDYRSPYWVTGAQQDSGAVAVRARGKFAQISMRDWEPIGAGGESGYTAGDKLHPGVIFGENGQRWDLEHNVQIPGTATPQVPQGQTARADWTQPLVFSAANPHALYYGNQYLFRTVDGARTWARISPDLTRPTPGIPPTLDAAAAADVGNDRRGVIYTIAPSPLRADTIWIGTDDGLVQLTTDGGRNWRDVTPPAIGAWSRVTMVEASHFDAGTAYASVDRHQLQDFAPHLFRTRDGGRSWQPIANGLPNGGYAHVVKEDPARRGLLFAGTELGAFVSFDDGDRWHPLQRGLPATSVRDFAIHDDDLVVATFGRGFYVIDDISALRQVEPTLATAPAHLFKPADVTYAPSPGDNGTPLQKDEPQAPNPPDGAIIDYYVGEAAGGGRDAVMLDILDAAGTVVHSWPQPPDENAGRRGRTGGIPNVSPLWVPSPQGLATTPGMHRVVWVPMTAGARRGFGGPGGRAPATPLTGTFTVRLTAGGQQYTQSFTVKPAPAPTE